MIYKNIHPAVFLSRPNRFIANILLDGREQLCHVKNTGRCKELLLPGSKILVQKSDNPDRKTKYDLISVYKGERLINMDAAAPNAVFGEWLREGRGGFQPELIKPECTHGDSRFDFYCENGKRRIFAEVKGVTLEEDDVVLFPDAPTQRGVKHLRGLIDCIKEGYEAWAVFIIQMKPVSYFTPNRRTHAEFADMLAQAAAAGVHILALDCLVTENSLTVADPVEVRL